MSPHHRDNSVLAAFALGHLANDWAVGAIWLVAPAMAISMGLGPMEVGLLVTVYGVGAALAYIPAGLLADRMARRGGLLLATFWWVGAGHLIASFMPDYWTFVLVMAIAVMGDAAWHPVATGYLVQRFPERRARVLGIHAMGGTLGAEVLAPLGVGAVLAFADWRTALQLAAVPALLMGVAFVFVSRRLGPMAVRADRNLDLRGLVAPWMRGAGLRLGLTMVLYNMAVIAAIAMMPLYLQSELGLGPMMVAVLFAGTLLAGSLMQPFAGHFSDRHGRRPLLLAGLLLGSAAAFVAGVATDPIVIVAGLVGSVAVLTAVRSVFLAAAVEVASQRESATLALAFTIMDGVGAIGALLAGLAGSHDLSRAFLLAAGLALMSAFVAIGRDSGNEARTDRSTKAGPGPT